MGAQHTSHDGASLVSLDWKDRITTYTGMVLVSLLSWWYLVSSWREMHSGSHMDMWMPPVGGGGEWGAGDFAMLFLMWSVMMLAMMLPVAFPLATVHASFCKKQKNVTAGLSNALLLGYVLVWILFGAAAMLVQWLFHANGILKPMMGPPVFLVSGLILVVAGVYQWTPMKEACLERCRSPVGFLIQHWHNSIPGTLLMGIRYGLFCVGCCWALMLLMLGLGVMNVLWMVAITLFMLLEKITPQDGVVRIVAGLFFNAWGIYWIFIYFGS